MRRKNRFDSFEAAAHRRSYDEFPMLEFGIDPQMHLSHNDVPQPFHLICEKDTVLAQLSGTARVEFPSSSVRFFDMEMGDFIYIPGGTAHRIVPRERGVQIRYKAAFPGREAVAWYAASTEISRVEWDCADEAPQAAYLRACQAFNRDTAMRTCPDGSVLDPIDLTPFDWQNVAQEIAEADEQEKPRALKKGLPVTASPSSLDEIPAAPDARPPLKANVYEFARAVTASLAPLFPYLGPGCIVPCIALNDAAEGSFGYFVHSNSVQELNLSFGTRGGMRTPGVVSVGPLQHPVGAKPGQEFPSDFFNLAVITQRQAEDPGQQESITFLCEKCDAVVFRREFGAHDFPDEIGVPRRPGILGMPTIAQSDEAVRQYNQSPQMRTCGSCGHVNQPFPSATWGWSSYRRRTHLVVEAMDRMKEAAGQASQAMPRAVDA